MQYESKFDKHRSCHPIKSPSSYHSLLENIFLNEYDFGEYDVHVAT